MDSMKLASGDNNIALPASPRYLEQKSVEDKNVHIDEQEKVLNEEDIVTPQMIDDNEMKLKDRIAQCRNIIESLKFELNEEKAKLEKETKTSQQPPPALETVSYASGYRDIPRCDMISDLSYSSSIYSTCVDSKLNCDENLMEYEKQLQKYQNTLNMAQIEKKNAIRKQMLAKAYRLKLLEVENQCNIELLRVKQSLQCLEPLKMIANQWKTNNDDNSCDYNNFELLPVYPELRANSMSDITFKEDMDINKTSLDKTEESVKNDSGNSDC